MKKKLLSQSAFFNPRTLLGLALCLFGFIVTLYAAGVLPGTPRISPVSGGAKPGSQKPDIVKMEGPVSQDLDLRLLPYVAPNMEKEGARRLRHPFPLPALSAAQSQAQMARAGSSSFFNQTLQSTVAMSLPSPMMTFDAIDSNLSGCNCLPPDSDGDVGSNHYIGSMNSSIGIWDKNGNALAVPITYNAFFSALGTGTPCGNSQNQGDGVVFYDHIADRWVVSDFAFGAFPGAGPFMQCVGVSKTSDPVAGGWYLYTVQVDPANAIRLGDYPKFGLWPDAYYLSMNEFSNNTTFNGVRVYALDRNSMINGGPTNAVGFTIAAADLGDQYSLVPATFRTGAPPAGQAEWFMDVNSSAVAGTVETQVFVRRFHVDFVTPANSTLGVGATHTPDGIITVNGFVDAAIGNIVPNGTTTSGQFLDTLGDKLMYPLVYQNINGKEYIYADQTVLLNYPNGPTAVRWYQFDMTGNIVPATPTQQQDWTNGSDGLWRWMPSINVDGSGNMAIGYSTSSTTINPGIRYAGRLSTDPPNTLAQGEGIMWAASGHQTDPSGRWGDYTALFADPSDNCSFWHTNEYYSVTGGANWRNRVGSFKFSQCTGSPPPTPTPTASPSVTPTPTPTPTPTATPTATPGFTPTPSPTPPASAGNVTVTASAGTVGPTGYTTVKGAFDAINAGTHQGAINVWVFADTAEAASAVLNGSGVGSASYSSVLMLPNGTRTVSGNLAAPLIDLNGAKNVRIDGYNQMTLSNTSTSATAGTSTIRFISTTAAAGGAQNNIVANCNIQGSSTAAEGAAGGAVLFSTTTASGTNIVGNNNNIIANNNIGPAGASLPLKAISMLGTAGNNTVNTGNVITNNNIFDFFNAAASCAGIDVRAGNQNSTISNNRLYQTATRTFTGAAGVRYSGILFSGTTGAGGNFITISGNTIGFGAANGTGTTTITGTGTGTGNEVRGIDLQGSSSGTATQVYGNTVSGINQTSSRAVTTTGLSAFAGISASNSAGASATGVFDIGSSAGNTIGSLDGSSTIVINATSVTASTTPVFGILAFSGSSDNVSNNKIGAITIQGAGTVTGFRGIFDGATAATTHTINNNQIGGSGSGSITDTQVGSYALYGIQTATAAVSITNNTIRNLNGNANGAALVVGGGIAYISTSTTAVSTISRNTISNLTNNSGAASNSIYAIDLTFPVNAAVTGSLVERNFIHSNSITSTDNTCQIWGIVNRGSASGTATATIQNNMIRLGIDAAGNSITGGFSIIGIRDIQGVGASAMNYYHNSVYIGGTGVVSTVSNSFGFNSGVTNTRNFRDNIFWNARSNASGAGKNYAITVAGTTPNPAGLTSNNNDLFATGTGGFVGLFNAVDDPALSDWKTATGQDANSISADPLFVNPTGNSATVDLHIQNGSPAIGAGIGVGATAANPLLGVLNDFDNDARNVCTPDIGADEKVPFVGPALSILKTVDTSTVVYGSQIGFKVWIGNTGTAAAAGVSFTDHLPGAPGINWSIDAGNSDAGWSITGSPPNQNLVYTPTTLAAGATAHVHIVSGTSGPSCGATYSNTASITWTGGCTRSASASVSIISTTSGTNVENFDSVVAPALPAGWVAANASGPAPLWVTSTATPDTAPNEASVDDPAVVSDKRLTSAVIAIPAAPTTVSFRNNYNLEGTFDGGVLEISINGGAFTDIVTAGGSFVTGGYTGVISSSFSNPLAGRNSWTGSAGGYITSTANLPAAAQGQNIQLRWRMGSDNSTAGTAWLIDTIVLNQQLDPCPAAPTLTSVVSRLTHGGSGTFDRVLSTSSRVIEPRDGSGNFKIVFTFNAPVTGGTASFSGTGGGSVGSVTFSGNTMIVNLTGVTDQQNATVTVNNVFGPNTGALSSASTLIGFLIGDVNFDATVNAGDTIVVRNNAGATLDNTNFQDDVNIDGFVNVGDTIVVRNRSGDFLP